MAKKIKQAADVQTAAAKLQAAGWKLVEDAEFMAGFELFDFKYRMDDGEMVSIFEVERLGRRQARFDNDIDATDPQKQFRQEKIEELAAYYSNACAMADADESKAVADAMAMRKSKKLNALSQEQKESIMALASVDFPGYFDEDETDESE